MRCFGKYEGGRADQSHKHGAAMSQGNWLKVLYCIFKQMFYIPKYIYKCNLGYATWYPAVSVVFRKTSDLKCKFYLAEAGSRGVTNTLWNSEVKPRLMKRYKPFNGRTVARATCKPKAKIRAVMEITRYKKPRCAKLQDHPATVIGQTATIWQSQRLRLRWAITARCVLLGVRGWAKYTWTP